MLAEQRCRSKAIDRQLRLEAKKLRRELKLLLLGAGESGKSTFVKQMRIIHGTGYSNLERQAMRPLIYDNLLKIVISLLDGMENLGLSFDTPEMASTAQRLRLLEINRDNGSCPFEPDHLDWIEQLWGDGGVQRCFARRREFSLPDSTKYFLEGLRRLTARNYVPADQDILCCRSPTTSILEYDFELDEVTYRIVDVGGQPSERRKWIYCFDGVTTVIFLAAISEYDQYNTDGPHSALEESIALWSTLLASPFFKKSGFILFLNKNDVFEEKIQTSHLSEYIPSYMGPRCNPDMAAKFLEDLFIDCKPPNRRGDGKEDPDNEMMLYVHRTTATNTENIRMVFIDVKDTVLDRLLHDYNIV